ncbi:MAG: RNA-binding protein [Acidobacteriota bacterium]
MNTKIYVDNLPAAATERELEDLFSAYGNVVTVTIVVDRTSQKPRGFGFVTMVTPEGARAAIQALNGKAINGNTLAASEAWPDEDRGISSNGRRQVRRHASKLF